MVLPESADVRTFDLGDYLIWYRSDAAGRFYLAARVYLGNLSGSC